MGFSLLAVASSRRYRVRVWARRQVRMVKTLVPIDVSFEKVGDNEDIADNKNLATNEWMPGKGKLIYPDAKAPDDETPRNEVFVKVTGVPQGWKVRLKVFDVDDPATEELDPNHVIDDNDTAGVKQGNDNKGAVAYFESSGWDTEDGTIDASGMAKLTNGQMPKLILPMQPGDNLRVAAILLKPDGTPFEGQDLSLLQVTNHTQSGYVAPAADPASGFNGGLSPMLTVWRKLHMEVDTMIMWSGDKPSPDRAVATGTSWQEDDPNQPRLRSILTLSGTLPEGNDFYAGGRIVSGGITLKIYSNTTTTITVDHPNGSTPLTSAQKDPFLGSFEVFDDDDTGISGLPLPKINAINTEVKKRYAPAYIHIQEVSNDLNPRKALAFDINNSVLNPFTALDDMQDMHGTDRVEYWNHLAVMAYQPETQKDADPIGGGLQGVTVKPGIIPLYNFYSVVYVETTREALSNLVGTAGFDQVFQAQIETVLAHEIGHAPGGQSESQDHAEGGLMRDDPKYDDPLFTPASLHRLRGVTRWH